MDAVRLLLLLLLATILLVGVVCGERGDFAKEQFALIGRKSEHENLFAAVTGHVWHTLQSGCCDIYVWVV